MTDIAQLGLAVDSSQVVSATAALNNLTAAAKPAADASAALESAAKGVSATMTAAGMTGAANGVKAIATAAKPAAAAMAELEATLNAYVADQEILGVAQRNGTTLMDAGSESIRGQRLVLRGIASDLAIFGTGLGQTAGMAGMLYYENMHVIEGFGGLKAAIGGLITPQNLLIAGFAALVVGGYEAVTSIIAQEKALDDLSHRTDETIQSLHGLEAAAAFKGINSADFEKTMTQFQGQVETLSSGLNTLFRANHVDDSGGLKDSLISLGDLIKNAASEADKYKIIQEAGLPATRQWVDFLSQGSTVIGQAAAKMGPLGSAMDPLVRKAAEFDEKWNTSIKNFSDGWRGAVIETIAWFEQLGPKISSAVVNAAGMWNKVAADAMQRQIAVALIAAGKGNDLSKSDPASIYKGFSAFDSVPGKKTTKSAADIQDDIQKNQQLMGLLGPLASIDQVVAQRENDITLARLASVPVTKAQEAAILDYTRAQALGITQIHSQTDALTVQSQTFAMLAGPAAAYAAVQTKINEAIRNGNPLTQQQIALLRQEAQALGDATERIDEMQTANAALSGAFKTFRNDMQNGTSAWTALKDAALSALNSISDKLIDMASKNLVAAAFGGGGGGGSLLGLFSGLFKPSAGSGGISELNAAAVAGGGLHSGGIVGNEATFTRYVHPAHFNDAPRFHDGGITGDEVPIIAKAGEGVFTPGQMKALAPVGAGGSPPVSVNVYQQNDFRGTDPSSMARINAALVQTKNQAVSEAINGILKLQKNAPGVARPT